MCPSSGLLFQLLEDNIVTFVKKELKKIQKVLSPDYPESSEDQEEDEDEEQKRIREAFLEITVNFLRRMKQEELADRLQSSKRIIFKYFSCWIKEPDTDINIHRSDTTLKPLKGEERISDHLVPTVFW